MELHDAYTTSAAIHLMQKRYGLNAMGFRQLLAVGPAEYRNMVAGKIKMTDNQKALIYSAFGELTGRIKE